MTTEEAVRRIEDAINLALARQLITTPCPTNSGITVGQWLSTIKQSIPDEAIAVSEIVERRIAEAEWWILLLGVAGFNSIEVKSTSNKKSGEFFSEFLGIAEPWGLRNRKGRKRTV